jgi:hypothetical protein
MEGETMKRLALALLFSALSSGCATPTAMPVRSPLVGHWVLEVDKLTIPPEARPKSVDLEFSQASDGKWTTHVSILDQAGHELHAEGTLSLDGTPGAASGTYWVDVAAATMPAPGVLVMQLAYHGEPSSTRVYTVSKDGRTMTETEAFFRRDGTPAMRIAYFSRAT